jgi:hypothetical protein
MPSTLPKKIVKRSVKQAAVPEVSAAAVLPVKDQSHHGMAAVTIILLFLTVGCLAAATLISEKMKTVEVYAQTLAAQLGEAQQQNSDLTDQLTTVKTLQALAKKIAMPVTPPVDTIWDTYASPNISLQYPDGYAVIKATSAFPVLTIKSEQGRIEIFRMKDFPNGDRPFGFADANVTQADLDNYIPKEFKSAPNPADPKIVPYSVWVYYGTGDEAAKAVLDQAVGTIKVAK